MRAVRPSRTRARTRSEQASPERLEAPGGGEVPERALHQPHVHRLGGPQLVLRGERLAQARASPRSAWRAPAPGCALHRRGPCTRAGTRIRLDVVHQREHLRRGVPDDRGAGDSLHELEFVMSIVENRKAFHDYFIEERYEAGIALEGWEVKAIRGGRGNIGEAYVIVRGARAVPHRRAHKPPARPPRPTYARPDPHAQAPAARRGDPAADRQGRAARLHARAHQPALQQGAHQARDRSRRGKLKHDKRADEREKEWNREKQRLLRSKSAGAVSAGLLLGRRIFRQPDPGLDHGVRD